MKYLVKNIRFPISNLDFDKDLRERIVRLLKINAEDISSIELTHKGLDARNRSQLMNECHAIVQIGSHAKIKGKDSCIEIVGENFKDDKPKFPLISSFLRRPVVVGTGPCGIFSALILAEAGANPIILERGESVENRANTVAQLRSSGVFNEKSNYCFGEGGAGTFSDGKLTCSRRHPYVGYLFDRWVEFGAPAQIKYASLPHIGSDNLVTIARKMRSHIEKCGGEFRFSTALTALKIGTDLEPLVLSLDNGEELETDHLVLAIGHAARDTLRMLQKVGLKLEPKPFAVGARVEHPQALIDEIQYGKKNIERLSGFLAPSSYKLTARAGERGVWSFCMCPGGILLPTNSQSEHLSVNGMSYFSRESGFANAALVVNVKVDDFYTGDPLDGVVFQEKLEKKAYLYGEGDYKMPAQRLLDFQNSKLSKGDVVQGTSYLPGVVSARIDHLLPDFIVQALKSALPLFENKMHGFLSEKAMILGVESKTSCPVTVLRGENHAAITQRKIFPAGEGAGYAGGIVSAALDGIITSMKVLGV